MMLVNAVRVFPDPVGDDTRTFLLWWMTGIALACGIVRSSNLSLNQVDMRGSIRPITSSLVYVLSTLSSISTTNRRSHDRVRFKGCEKERGTAHPHMPRVRWKAL